MSNAKSKLGQNPLTTRGVGALFSQTPEPAPSPKAVVAQGAPKSSAKRTKHKDSTSVSHLVNKVTQPSDDDETDFVRHTFYLTEAQGQKVKLYALLHRMQISEVIRMLVDNNLKIQP